MIVIIVIKNIIIIRSVINLEAADIIIIIAIAIDTLTR